MKCALPRLLWLSVHSEFAADDAREQRWAEEVVPGSWLSGESAEHELVYRLS